ETVSTHLDETTGFFVSHPALRERIARAEVELDQRIAEATAPQTATGASLTPDDASLTPDEQAFAQAFDAIDPDVSPPDVPAAAAAPEDDEPPSTNYDVEVAAIFSDEANELLEECQSSFQQISLTAPSREEFAALKRPLHT